MVPKEQSGQESARRHQGSIRPFILLCMLQLVDMRAVHETKIINKNYKACQLIVGQVPTRSA